MSIRGTILACLTALASIAMIIAFVSNRERYSLVSNDKTLYVFDKKTATINHCDDKNCQLITPQGTTVEAMRTMAGMPAQKAIIQAQQQPNMVGFIQQPNGQQQAVHFYQANQGNCPDGCTPDPTRAAQKKLELSSLQTPENNFGKGFAQPTAQSVGMNNLVQPMQNFVNPMQAANNMPVNNYPATAPQQAPAPQQAAAPTAPTPQPAPTVQNVASTSTDSDAYNPYTNSASSQSTTDTTTDSDAYNPYINSASAGGDVQNTSFGTNSGVESSASNTSSGVSESVDPFSA